MSLRFLPVVLSALILTGTARAASIFTTQLPGPGDFTSNARSIELGVRFRADSAGLITGLRFYKAAGNTGTHTGHLWTNTGTLLGSLTFTGETATGWQSASFASPIAIQAGTTYVASYHTASYSVTRFTFAAAGIDNPPLHALRDGVDGANGLYVYSSAAAFPNRGTRSSNYWVDVLFSASGPDIVPPTVTISSPTGGAAVRDVVAILAAAADDVAVTTVQFKLDGAALGPPDLLAPYAASWNTTLSADGAHSLSAVAWDAAGNASTSAAVAVTVDNAPPLISSVALLDVGLSSAVVAWITNEASTSQVEYGTSTAYGSETALDASTVTAHSRLLSGLAAGTSYHYRVRSLDAAGNLAASGDSTFSTVFVPDVTPPTVSISSPAGGAAVRGAVAVVAAVFDDVAVTAVQFRLDGADLGAPDAAAPYAFAWDTALSSDGPHSLAAVAWDAAGNASTSAAVAVMVDNDPPLISSIALADVGHSSAAVVWSTNEPSTSQVEYGTTAAYGSFTALDSSTVTSHARILSGLSAGTLHHYRVRSADAAGNLALSGDQVFTTNPFTVIAPATATIFTSQLPAPGDYDINPNPIEVGVRFRSDTSGQVTGVRFYKVSGNTGPHVGHLWTNTGTLLGSIDFTGETATGWQTASFAAPIAIQAGTTYVASFHSTKGYAVTRYYFAAAGIDNPPLHALRDAVAGPNGAYAYSSGAVFPNSGTRSSNYWVDVVFSPSNAVPAVSALLPSSAAAGGAGFALQISGAGFAAGSTARWNGADRTTTFVSTTALSASIAAADVAAAGTALVTVFNPAPGGGLSNAATFTITAPAVDTEPPSVAISLPLAGALLRGAAAVTAAAADDVAVTTVQFKLDGAALGPPDALAPYGLDWDTAASSDGPHSLTAVAWDAAGNASTSPAVVVTVDNTPPAIDSVVVADIGRSSAAVAWITNEASTSQVEYGTSTAYGSATALDASTVTAHSRLLSGLAAGTLYHYRVKSADTAGNLSVSVDGVFSTIAAATPTVVSLTFDDGTITHLLARDILNQKGVKGTFYINSGRIGLPLSLNLAQVRSIAADGHEIGGHTVDHVNVSTLTAEQLQHQICDDRTALVAAGFNAVSFAYPYGAYSGAAASMASTCGYKSARRVGGLGCPSCPAAMPIPPPDAFGLLTPDSIKSSTTLAAMQQMVTDAEQGGGGWVPIVMHSICDGCGEYSVSSATLAAFIDWVKPRAASGTVIQTMAEVMGADTESPTVAVSSPIAGAMIAGAVAVTAAAFDDVAVATVQFKLDGAALGPPDASAPFSLVWDTALSSDGPHSLTAVAWDTTGNPSTSAAVSVTVDNTPPVISSAVVTASGIHYAAIAWITDEPATSRVEYGTSAAYGGSTALDPSTVAVHDAFLSGLSTGTLYHFRVLSADALGNLAVSADSTFTSAAASATVSFFDDFSSYTPDVCLADGAVFGPWTSVFNGYGCTSVRADGGRFWLEESPFASASSSETHAALVSGLSFTSPMTLSVDLRTTAQLRTNAPPNPWEAAWVVWNYTDNSHFYYFVPKPNGWELGKEDPAYPGGQRFLAAGSSPVFPIGGAYHVKIVQTMNVISAHVDGVLITTFTDMQRPYTSGHISLYTEDAAARFTNVAVNVATPTVSIQSPQGGAFLAGTVAVTAAAFDDVAVATVQFRLDGADLGPPDVSAPFSAGWNTALSSDGAHGLTALAWDADGNASTSAAVSVKVDNTAPVASSVVVSDLGVSSATIAWITDEPSNSQVEYGTSTAYGGLTTLDPSTVTVHGAFLSGLSAGTLYHYRIRAADAAGNLAASDDQTFTTAASDFGCQTSAGVWRNTAFPPQVSSFTVSFDVRPDSAGMEASVGISRGAAGSLAALAAGVRFNSQGFIDVRYSTAHARMSTVAYSTGTSYRFDLRVNASAHIFDVYVTSPGASRVLLARNYTFRSSQSTSTVLDNLGLLASPGSATMCNLTVAASTVPWWDGIRELYATAAGSKTWYSTWDNGIDRSFGVAKDPTDPWFDSAHGSASYLVDAASGVFKISGTTPRMYIHHPEFVTGSSSLTVADSYAKQWHDVEMTVYGMRVADSNVAWAGIDGIARSNHGMTGSETVQLCDTRGMGARFRNNGRLDFEKETRHPTSYAVATTTTTLWPSGTALPFNVWIGFKYVVYDLPNGNVKAESYMDMTNGVDGGTWVLVNQFEDTGANWGGGTPCRSGVNPQERLTNSSDRPGSESGLPNVAVYFRSDGVGTNGLLYKKMSIREIVAPTGGAGPLAAAGEAAGPAGTAPAAAEEAFVFRDLYAFPNPSRRGERVTIRLQAGVADGVDVDIFDLSGRRVDGGSAAGPALVDDGNGKGPQFTYDYHWNVDGARSAVYLYTVKARKQGQPAIGRTGKVALIK